MAPSRSMPPRTSPASVRDAISESLGLPRQPFAGGRAPTWAAASDRRIALSRRTADLHRARKLGRSLKWTATRLEDSAAAVSVCRDRRWPRWGSTLDRVAICCAGRRHREMSGPIDLSLTTRPGAGPGRRFLARSLQDPVPNGGAVARRCRRQAARRTVPAGSGGAIATRAERFAQMDLTRKGAPVSDPMEISRRNLVRAGRISVSDRIRDHLDKTGFFECLDAAGRGSGYQQLRFRQADARKQGRLFGIGIATYAELTGIGSRIAVAPGMPNQYRFGDGKRSRSIPPAPLLRPSGRLPMARGLRRTLAQIITDDLGAISRLKKRHPGRQRRGSDVDRHLCEPQCRAWGRRRQACPRCCGKR